MRTDRLRLLDAIEQIELISSFSVRGREAFFNDLIVQSAVLHRLALLGEACRGVSSELREAHPEIPWPQIVGFRTAQLWQATVNLRGSIEPADYKRYVLPIIFLRFLSLRYERRRAELERLIADPASEHYTTDPRVAADIPVSYQQGASAPFAITGILQNDSEEERRQDGVYARLSANLATSSRLRNSETRPPSAA
jgi:hypothetical protein